MLDAFKTQNDLFYLTLKFSPFRTDSYNNFDFYIRTYNYYSKFCNEETKIS